MQFCIENVSKSSGRIGQLVIITDTRKHFKTPLLLQATKSGSIPHLSRDVFDYVSKEAHVLQVSLATTLRMADVLSKYKEESGLSRYIGFTNYPTMMILNDPCEPLPGGHNDKNIVPIFTKHGKEQITSKRFMNLIECFSPNIYVGLCDADTNYASSKKRIQKSFERTTRFMDDCFKWHRESERLKRTTLFAPIVGGYSTFIRTKSIEHANKEGEAVFGGYSLEGFHNGGPNALDVNGTALYDTVEHCLKQLNAQIPRLMTGPYTPIVTLELIRLGVDIFDTSYACLASRNFKALTFCFDLNNDTSISTSAYLDVTDESYKEDFSPIMEACECLVCEKHTRSYVHHLYKTNELLGPILLMMHNLHHYIEFFKTIRVCISNDRLPELLKLIKYQNGEKEVNYHVKTSTLDNKTTQTNSEKTAEQI